MTVIVSAPPPPWTVVRPPWAATTPVERSVPATSVPAIVRPSLPSPSRTFRTSIVVVAAPAGEPKVSGAPMPRPVSEAAVSVPTRSSRLESANTSRTSTCCDSGGWGAIFNSGPSLSPGSRSAGCSERSAAVAPPSTASGPRNPLSTCGRFAKLRRFSAPAASSNDGSATSGTVTSWCQFVASNVATAAHCVTVTVAGTLAGFAVAVSVRAAPAIDAILYSVASAPILMSWPARKPSSSQLVPSVRVRVPSVASYATPPVNRPLPVVPIAWWEMRPPVTTSVWPSVSSAIVTVPVGGRVRRSA